MPSSPNKLFGFWQEIKRRNVHRLMAVYGGTAYIIFEASTIIFPRWGLPDWTIDLVLYLLILGAIVTFILGWIYDINPEGGIEKTVPIHKVKPEDTPKSSNGWKVASYISFLVIIALIALNVITRFGQRKILEHSIAVLPFENDSQDQDNDYLIAGYRTSIVDMLSKIEDLRVLPRVSTDQYRDNPRAPREIAEELDVSYLILANGQKYGNQIVLTVQLVDTKEKLIWSHSYEKQIQSPQDHIKIQSEIAQLVAKEVGAHVTPVEKQRIEKIPTTNNEAYNYYTRGREEVVINSGYYRMTDSRSKAKNLFHRSLELDSTFALAYAGLGWVYMYENESEIKYLGAHVDSALYYVQKALSYDDQLGDAYEIRGDYYRLAGNFDLSEADLKRAIDINPNSWFAYHTLANLYINYQDYILGLSNLHKAATLCTGEMLESILARTGGLYAQVGFGDIAKSYFAQVLNLNGDSLEYYRRLAFVEWNNGNIREQLEYEIKASKLNPSLARDLELGMCYFLVNDFRHALLHYEKYLEYKGDSTGELFDTYHRLAYAYTQTGSKDKAKYYFEKQTETCIEAEKTGSYYFVSGLASYDLAGVYAATGQRSKSMDYLRKINQVETYPAWGYHLIRLDPLFSSIRDDPEFQKIVHDIEFKYLTEHNRVRQWLEENEML